ncbi:VOC family protein [Agrobacterium vaccinii]|uniref:VOC family protein n=1 Tax=Agrobacterium vaccinii TaxID=2735528 RepID=UPI001E4DAA42|nr:VOC family protein [Agrobacterium vaccinii]UHS61100.1 VOC family protein [Agrobacterium vaccinii]
MLKLDHLTVIAPTLSDGVSHVENCLGVSVPFVTNHEYMGTHNHRLQLGNSIYLEIVALDPVGKTPGRARWFGLDNQEKVRADWNEGRRLRGWVANTNAIDPVVARHGAILGEKVSLPDDDPTFDFAIPRDGALPLDGVAPSVIDHWGDDAYVALIPDLGARLRSLTLEHPDPASIGALYRELGVDHPPIIVQSPSIRYRALIDTPSGLRELT